MFKFLDKAHNKIGDESCKYFATAKLIGLRDLNLSTPDKNIKKTIKFMRKDANIFAKLNCQNWITSIYVLKKEIESN